MFTISSILLIVALLFVVNTQQFRNPTENSFVYIRHGGYNNNTTRLQRFGCGAKCNRNSSCYGFSFSSSNNCIELPLRDLLSETDTTYYIKRLDIKIHEATTNVAIGATAVQSSTFEPSRPASMCVDDNLDCGHSKISHTADEKFPWWLVDLGGVYVVRKIVIWNTQHSSYYDRLHDFEIRVGNVPITKVGKLITENALYGEHTGGGITGEPVTFVWGQRYPVFGRFVSVQIVRYCTSCYQPDKNYLQMCEVQVFGYKIEG
ncbi:fucolectin-like [Tachypleus tridentatus]|uniref:fucolectin-like n=1 Tax=Tachypleus tridentatus TaxID=6853 RepID=UPI003FD06CB8